MSDISQQRLTGAETIAALLKKKRGLRKGLAVDSARDIIWVYNDPGLHHALVADRGWNQTRYRDWLTYTLRHQLLG